MAWVQTEGGGEVSAQDAEDVTYTPTVLADWDGGTDPGNVDGALDQLGERVKDIEGAGIGGGDLIAANNLSDVASAATAFANIKQAATTEATGVVELATDGENASGKAVQGNDSRLSDARTPTSHAHGNVTNDGKIGSTAGLPIKTGTSGLLEAGAFGTSAGEFAAGNHTHAQLHDAATVTGNGISINGQQISLSIGTSANQVAAGNHNHDGVYATSAQGALADTAVQPSDLADVATSGSYGDLSGTPTLGTAAGANTGDFAAASHAHGNVTSAGAIGSTSGLPLKTGTGGVLETGAFGTSAGQFAEGNHIHDATAVTFTPTTSSDWTGGSDPGNVDDALDQIAGRVKTIEGAGIGGGDMVGANNLSDVASAATAFANIKQAATTSATGVVELATDGENAPGVVVQGNDLRLSNNRTPTSHAHGNITNAGAIGSTSGLPVKTGTGGALETGAFGASAGQFAAGDDSRFHTRSHAITSTDDHTAGNWKVFHSNGSGQMVELALGADGTYLKSNGSSSAPSFATPAGGGGNVSVLRLANEFATSSVALQNVTGMSFEAAANSNYNARFVLVVSTNAAASGLNFDFTGPASPTSVMITAIGGMTSTNASRRAHDSAVAVTKAFVTGFSAQMLLTEWLADAGNTGGAAFEISLDLQNGANGGTVQLRVGAEVAGSEIRIRANSHAVLVQG
jgi:hypothetical protein